MNMLMSIAIWLATLFGVPTATGEEVLDVGDRQTTSQSATTSSSSDDDKKRGLTRKGYIYNGF